MYWNIIILLNIYYQCGINNWWKACCCCCIVVAHAYSHHWIQMIHRLHSFFGQFRPISRTGGSEYLWQNLRFSKPSLLTMDQEQELSPQHYKKNGHLYVKDAVRLLLGRRDERPIPTVYEYFKSIITGSNVHCREYAYVYATQRNRLAFILHLDECYPHLSDSERLTPNDYHQLLCIVCSDFPKSIVDEALMVWKKRLRIDYFEDGNAVFYHDFLKKWGAFSMPASTNRRPQRVTPTTVSVENILLPWIICYKTDDTGATSTIVLALADSKNRAFCCLPLSSQYQLLSFSSSANVCNQWKAIGAAEAKAATQACLLEEHQVLRPIFLNQIVADELAKQESAMAQKGHDKWKTNGGMG